MIPYTLLIIVGIVIVVLILIIYGIGFTSIGSDEVGIVEKWWSSGGSVPAEGLIALKGEAGYQPQVLRAGVHFKTPFKYRVKKVRLVTIPQGQNSLCIFKVWRRFRRGSNFREGYTTK